MNLLTEKLNLTYPIIQAGMAGGITSPELVAGVSNAGALGTIGAGYMDPPSLRKLIQKTKDLTEKSFAVNLFACSLEASDKGIRPMQGRLNLYREELGIRPGALEVEMKDHLEEKVQVIIEESIPIVSSAFGVFPNAIIDLLKQHGTILIGMATNTEEAVLLEQSGYDFIVAQGTEAGGHRGTFDVEKHPKGSNIGLLVLLAEVLEKVSIPLIASGGIYTKKQVDALLGMGASGVQVGTGFLAASEAGTNEPYRKALIDAEGEDTVITSVFSGRPARAIRNRFVTEMESSGELIRAFPVQNELTGDIRKASAAAGSSSMQSLWAGQGVGFVKKIQPAKDIIQGLVTGEKELPK